MKALAFALGLAALSACAPQTAVPVSRGDTPVLERVNALRATRGLAPLRYSAVLERIAASHARELSRTGGFSHRGRDGSTPGQRLARAGYAYCVSAENIARGQGDLDTVMQTWRGSGGHRRNMLHRDIRELGLARASGDVWVMVLAAPRGSC